MMSAVAVVVEQQELFWTTDCPNLLQLVAGLARLPTTGFQEFAACARSVDWRFDVLKVLADVGYAFRELCVCVCNVV